MKQLSSLLLFLLLLILGYYGYGIYFQKNYWSPYQTLKMSSKVEIKEITLDTDKITRLSKNIKSLKQDPVFRLKLNDFTTVEGQPLIRETYGTIYEKIVKQNQMLNRSNSIPTN